MRIRYQVCVVFIDHCALNCIATRLSLDPISQLCQSQQPHTSIPSLASPIQLNCHRDVPNLSLHLTPTPEPQTSPPPSRSLPPPCPSHRSALYVASSLAGILILVFPLLLSPRLLYPVLVPFLSLTYCNATTFYQPSKTKPLNNKKTLLVS